MKLNYFELAVIPTASLGLSVMMIGNQFTPKYGAGTALCSIIVGNLLLWLIGIVVITMTGKDKLNAIQNFQSYIGEWGGKLVALILIFAFLSWFALHINHTVAILESLHLFTGQWDKNVTVRAGTMIGLITTLLAMGGVTWIKRITLFCLPLLFCYYLYAFTIPGKTPHFTGTWGLSLHVITYTFLLLLPGYVNLPTLFRYARTRADAYLALSCMFFFISFFQIFSIWISLSTAPLFVLLFLILFSGINSNLLNIYFSSVSWDIFVPKFSGAKGYAVIGLLGTAIYTFIQISAPVRFLENLALCYIASLGIVMLIAFLMRVLVRHRLKSSEKIINAASWIIGCITATFFQMHATENYFSLLAGVSASALFFMFVLFIEQMIWAIKNIPQFFKNKMKGP